MSDQRPFSRFRLPWVTAAPRPAAEPQPPRPTPEVQAPPQPIVTIPQRPFRPGLPSIQSPPPPQVQAPQRTEPQSPPATTESQVRAQPASLSSATTQTEAASVPPSPTPAKSEGRAVSQILSPSWEAPQPRAASVPPSPTRTTSQPAVSQPPAISIEPPPSAYQQQPKPAPFLLFSQAAQQTTGFKPVSEPAEREKKYEEEAVDKLKKEEKTNGTAEEEPMKSTIAEQLTSWKTGSEAREQKQQEMEDNGTTIISSSEEHIKTVSSTQPKARIKSTESHQKPSTSNGEHVSLPKEIRGDISKFVHKLGVGKLKYPIDDKPVSVVTIAGENTGASMRVGAEPARKDGSIHIHRGYKLNPDDSTGATTDGEGSTEGKRSKIPTKEDSVTEAYVNSNTQSINNSVVFDSTVNEQSPGVHLSLSHDLAEPNKPSGEPEPPQAHRAEFSVTPAQKLTYEPTIRRRCLRGLFLEPSDSDNDDPEKPRRHGCRYGCGEKSKDTDVGVL